MTRRQLSDRHSIVDGSLLDYTGEASKLFRKPFISRRHLHGRREAFCRLTDIAALETQLEEARSVADKSRDDVLRIRAEMENLRKRQARELENAHKYALDKIALELLPVRDTLEMGVAAAETEGDLSKIAEGTGLTLKMLTQALEKFNIVEVDPEGDKFDPDLHQAISVQEGTDKPANTVLNVMQKGYTLNDRLLRPAMVVIAK